MSEAMETTDEERLANFARMSKALGEARAELRTIEAKYANASWFKSVALSVSYTQRRDGGDASVMGVIHLDLNDKDIRQIVELQIEAAKSRLATMEVEHSAEAARWVRASAS